jgi:hypothetical protein
VSQSSDGFNAAGGSRPPAWVVVLAAFVAAAAVFLSTRMYTATSTRVCHRRYKAALTPADSAVVDTTVVTSARDHGGLQRCGTMRYSARWR